MRPWHLLTSASSSTDASKDQEVASAAPAGDPRFPGLVPSGRPLLCLSDIHGDIDALDSVLRATSDLELCGVVAAGDHCLGGPAPFLVWQRLQQVSARLVRGTSDLALGALDVEAAWPRSRVHNVRQEARRLTFFRTRQALGDIVCRRLAELPATEVVSLDDRAGVMIMHGSPRDDTKGLIDDDALADQIGCVAEDVLVVGQTHKPFARQLPGCLVVNCGATGLGALDEEGKRSAFAVLLFPCTDGVVRAYGKHVDVERLTVDDEALWRRHA